jgi:hypothetical protein
VITAKVAATRVTGTAPLAVLFDASSTTATSGIDTFRQVTYSFNFGDNRGLTWAVSGKSKNTETGGPIAAHVFDVPGTYTVTTTAKDASGNTSTTTVSITVADPASVYAGTKTICVSGSGDYSGCPSGAAQQTTMPSGTGWNGKRVLLHKGESFGDISIQDGNVGVQVASYGSSSAKPVVSSVGIGNWRPATTTFANDVTVMDLQVKNGVGQSIGQRVLVYRNDISATGAGIAMGLGAEDYWANGDPYMMVPKSSFYNAREIFFVENTAIGKDTSSMSYGLFGSGSRVALLGNRIGSQQYHSVRMVGMNRGVIAHNELQGISSAGIYHSLKVHAGGLSPYADNMISTSDGSVGWASSLNVIANNLIGNANDNNQWTAAICPQNDQRAEGIENTIVENNKYVRGRNTVTDLVLGGRKLTYRGNTSSGSAISEGTGHTGALSSAWQGPYYTN